MDLRTFKERACIALAVMLGVGFALGMAPEGRADDQRAPSTAANYAGWVAPVANPDAHGPQTAGQGALGCASCHTSGLDAAQSLTTAISWRERSAALTTMVWSIHPHQAEEIGLSSPGGIQAGCSDCHSGPGTLQGIKQVVAYQSDRAGEQGSG